MQKPNLSLYALVALSVLSSVHPALAQHRGATAHAQGSKAAAAPHVNQGSVPNANAQEVKMMQQQMEREQKFIMQRQAQMAEMENKAHQQRIQGYNAFLKSNPASTGANKTTTTSNLPQSPAAFASWYNTQKHNKARNKSYDPAYDEYREFEKAQVQTSTKHRAHKTGTMHASQSTANTQVAAQQSAQSLLASQPEHNPLRSSVLNGPSDGQQPRQTAAMSNSTLLTNPTRVTTTAGSTNANPTTTGSTTVPATIGSAMNGATTPVAHHTNGTRQPINRLAAVGSAVNRLPWAADQAVISHLRNAHAKLQQADRDYQGHRARGAGHVVNALRHLGASSLPGSNMIPVQNQLAQAQSDAMLRDALFRLNTAQGQLTSRTSLASHQGNARTQIAQAIQELNVALSVR